MTDPREFLIDLALALYWGGDWETRMEDALDDLRQAESKGDDPERIRRLRRVVKAMKRVQAAARQSIEEAELG